LLIEMKMASMSASPLDQAATQVLREFLHSSARVQPLGNCGGFSGARLWRIETQQGSLCLKARPPGNLSAQRWAEIHRLMRQARDSDLLFVPAIHFTHTGQSLVEHAERLWDLTAWMPGRADFHLRPEPARLEAASLALARLHRTWALVSPERGPSPGIERRLGCTREWSLLIQSGWEPRLAADNPLHPWVQRAWSLVRRWIDSLPHLLAPWAERPLPLQPCLCDIWHDHVLFEGNTVTGLIDFDGTKIDHVAVDLARLLGSMVGGASEPWAAALRAYARVCRLSLDDQALASVLDRTGTLVGLVNWLQWLCREGRTFDHPEAALRRLSVLVERVESWP
jgi:Ser/Thr protein kinase RdoA (MazF antagonist)